MHATVDLTAAVAAATRAPSLHNSQPWRFRVVEDAIELWTDPLRQLPATDPTGWGARVAGGAALLNLRLAIALQGWQPLVQIMPDPNERELLAVLTLGPRRPASPAEQQLATAIWRRHSHRAPFWPDPVPASARARLTAAARAEEGWLELLVGPGPAAAVAELSRAADRLLMREPAYRAELASWIRVRAAEGSGPDVDGVPAEAAGGAPQPQDLLPMRPYSDRPALTAQDTDAFPLVAVLGTAGDTPGDQVIAGQVLQRVLLTATDGGLAVSMVSQPIEVPAIREQLRLSLGQYGAPQMVLRVGYGLLAAPTPRRPITEVIDQAPIDVSSQQVTSLVPDLPRPDHGRQHSGQAS